MKKIAAIILSLTVATSIFAAGCEKQKGQNQQTPDSSPTSTSPMNPK